LFFTNPFIGNVALTVLEGKPQVAAKSNYEVGIVLTGMLYPSSHASGLIQFHDATDRIIEALRLYKKGAINKILITGGSGSIKYNQFVESEILQSLCVEMGVPPSSIIFESASKNTYQNAVNTMGILRGKGLDKRRLLLITSAFHMNRAAACFEKQGVKFDEYRVDIRTEPIMFDLPSMVPDSNVLGMWKIITSELSGVMIYKLVGYI
jgi:uncharacterized SAM-binding protein YcdF (DUF218 family)